MRRKISVIIGNPPYNANQANENDNNKNREYPRIDELIKASYIRQSTAQKTKVYDMYARFFRWASDRMHDDGVLAFITNRSFIDSRTFDGFRKAVWPRNSTKSTSSISAAMSRANPKLSGTKNNVFGIQTGVAISFMVKRRKQKGCKIFYARRPEFDTADDKLAFLGSQKLSSMPFERVVPDKNANWINLTDNDWDSLIPVADKKTKGAKTSGQERAIFKLFSTGIISGRDEWIYDYDEKILLEKCNYFLEVYQQIRQEDTEVHTTIKTSRNLKRKLGRKLVLRLTEFQHALFRPFLKKSIYFSDVIVDEIGCMKTAFSGRNVLIDFLGVLLQIIHLYR